jgi:hypothetical protein
MRGSIGALLCSEAGSGAAGHVAACGCMLCPSSWLGPSTLRYPVCRVLIVAPGPNLGEASNLQVGPRSFFPVQPF